MDSSGQPQDPRGDDGIASSLTSLRDLSLRKVHERDLHVHARVIESMAEGVSPITTGGIVVYTNPAEDQMFGAKPGELLDKPLAAHKVGDRGGTLGLLETIASRIKERGFWGGRTGEHASGRLPRAR